MAATQICLEVYRSAGILSRIRQKFGATFQNANQTKMFK